MIRVLSGVVLALLFSTARAEGSRAYASLGGWAYDITGTYTNTNELDLEDDLGLQSTARSDYYIGYAPAALGWIPAVEFGYTRIAADGQQTFAAVPLPGVGAVTGGLIPDTVVSDRTNVNDFELNVCWPWRLGDFTLLGGFTVTTLKGSVMAADENTGEQQTQKINQTFPLLSVGVEWQPAESLRFSLSGDYVQYNGNRADELEARVVWKFLGPIGLEGGYRQRRYKIVEPMNALDARVAGARVGVIMEIPFQ